jgi:5-(carboxyamino)imidazole ribonucleotide mutase
MDHDNIDVAIIIGSKSDEEVMKNCIRYLEYFEIRYELRVLSAHRNPDVLHNFVSSFSERGVQVVIAAAGMAAHLPGVVASLTPIPVIGVPLSGSELKGMDALLSIVQMPTGIPVATVAIGKAGAANAAVLAAEILSLTNSQLKDRLKTFRAAGSKL